MDQVIQIVTVATRQPRESSEEQRGMIERALKLGAKTYDGTGDPEAGFLMAATAKDWWEAIKRRHPT